MKQQWICLISIFIGHSTFGQTGMVTDYDGNVYPTVAIGTQVWMAQNLKTSHYANGNAIIEIEDTTTWNQLYNTGQTTPAFCYYNGDSNYNAIYGKLYDWYATADTSQLCPVGWHLPSDSEWEILSNYLGGDANSGGHMKSLDTLWLSPNVGADDSSGFSTLPGGYRFVFNNFNNIRQTGYFWATDRYSYGNNAWCYWINANSGMLQSHPNGCLDGFSVRCLKNPVVNGIQNIDRGTNNLLQVFPNPSTGDFSIKITCGESEKHEIEIRDLSGKRIADFNYTTGIEQFSFSLVDRGIYLINMVDSPSNVVKLVIE